MKTLKNKRQARLADFAEGQVWRTENSKVFISMIGKRLVHYKVLKLTDKRAAISISNKASLAQYLLVNKAVLVAA